MALRDEKLAVRAAALAARDALSADRRRHASDAIAERVLALPAIAKARTVALFASIRSEVDTAAIDAGVLARGLTTAYPRILRSAIGETRTELVFYRVLRDDLVVAELTPSNPGSWRLAIPEPPDDPESRIAPAEIDVFIVPGVAFDPSRHRLGYGRGYYDRVLEKAPRSAKIGIAFEAQIVPSVPVGPGDVDVDLVVTEERVIR